MIKYLVDADEHWKVKAVIEDSLKDFLQKNDAKIEKIKTSFLTYDGFINARVESVQNEIPASAGMTEKG